MKLLEEQVLEDGEGENGQDQERIIADLKAQIVADLISRRSR